MTLPPLPLWTQPLIALGQVHRFAGNDPQNALQQSQGLVQLIQANVLPISELTAPEMLKLWNALTNTNIEHHTLNVTSSSPSVKAFDAFLSILMKTWWESQPKAEQTTWKKYWTTSTNPSPELSDQGFSLLTTALIQRHTQVLDTLRTLCSPGLIDPLLLQQTLPLVQVDPETRSALKIVLKHEAEDTMELALWWRDVIQGHEDMVKWWNTVEGWNANTVLKGGHHAGFLTQNHGMLTALKNAGTLLWKPNDKGEYCTEHWSNHDKSREKKALIFDRRKDLEKESIQVRMQRFFVNSYFYSNNKNEELLHIEGLKIKSIDEEGNTLADHLEHELRQILLGQPTRLKWKERIPEQVLTSFINKVWLAHPERANPHLLSIMQAVLHQQKQNIGQYVVSETNNKEPQIKTISTILGKTTLQEEQKIWEYHTQRYEYLLQQSAVDSSTAINVLFQCSLELQHIRWSNHQNINAKRRNQWNAEVLWDALNAFLHQERPPPPGILGAPTPNDALWSQTAMYCWNKLPKNGSAPEWIKKKPTWGPVEPTEKLDEKTVLQALHQLPPEQAVKRAKTMYALQQKSIVFGSSQFGVQLEQFILQQQASLASNKSIPKRRM